VARRAGDDATARAALRRAFIEVQRKARRLHDAGWRTRYLEATPACDILAEARQAGVDAEPESIDA
jgi:hypothetical protein